MIKPASFTLETGADTILVDQKCIYPQFCVSIWPVQPSIRLYSGREVHDMKVNRMLVALILIQFTLTIGHHLYGEFFLYKDGVRLHIAVLAPLALMLTFAPLWIHRNSFGVNMHVFWTLLVWVFGIGIYEGLWNHVTLNVFTILNLSEFFSLAFIRTNPGDFVFELTGAAQFIVACMLAYTVHRLYPRSRGDVHIL